MADKLSVQQFAAKIRERRPDAAAIPDMTLVGKVLAAAPQLKDYVDLTALPGTEKGTFESPKYGPTGPNATEMVSEQAANVLKGIPQAVTGIPAAAKSVFNILKSGLSGKAGEAVSQTGDLVKGALHPFTTTARGVGALAGVSEAPTDEEFANAAQGAGAMLGAAELPNVVSGLREGAAALSQTAPAQKVASAFQSIKGKFQKVPITAPEVNKWMDVSARDVEHGANPGQRLLDQGLVKGDKVATKAAVDARIPQVGQQLQDYLQGAEAQGVTLDGESIVNKALGEAQSNLRSPTDMSFKRAIQSIKDKLGQRFPDIDRLPPTQAHELKVYIGDQVDWRLPERNPINDALKDIYRGLNNEIDSKVIGIKPIQQEWGDLYLASRNLADSMKDNLVGRGTPNAAPKPQASPVFKKLKKAAPYAAGAAGLEGVRRLYNIAKPD